MSSKHDANLTWCRADAVGIAVIALLTLTAYLLVVRPMSDERAACAAVRAQLTDADRESDRLEGGRRRLQAELDRVRSDLEASPLHLQPAKHLNRRLALVVNHATASGLEISGTRAGEVLTGSHYDTVPIQVSGEGSFTSCATFLNRLRLHLPDVEVVGFELSGRTSTKVTRTAFRFDLSWYAAASSVVVAGEE